MKLLAFALSACAVLFPSLDKMVANEWRDVFRSPNCAPPKMDYEPPSTCERGWVEWIPKFKRSYCVAGVYYPASNRGIVVNGEHLKENLHHELTHAFLHCIGPGDPDHLEPIWDIVEGQ